MLHAVIMAGGSGTRFWPASRGKTPKQLLPLVGEQTMIRQTFQRLAGLVDPEQILVVTNRALVDSVRSELPELPKSCIVGEPCKRDTAPCIGLAAKLIARQTADDATMLVLPADHVIQNVAQFQNAVRAAAGLIANRSERIVTFGIEPTYPAESFGYIHRGSPIDVSGNGCRAFAVSSFREKPNADVARSYVESGEYYWNAGIFLWGVNTIDTALARLQPDISQRVGHIAAAWGSGQQEAVFTREFEAMQGISIDYAVMEHATDVAVVEAPFDWDDVGSWQSIARLKGCDPEGNSITGRHLGMRTTNSIIQSDDDHLVVTLGIKDCIVVRTPDATLVANKHDEEAIREVVKQLEQNGWHDVL